MPENKYKNINHDYLLSVLFGIAIGIAVTFISLLIFAAVYAAADIDEYYNAVFATVSLICGSFFGAMFTVSKIKNKGFIYGTLVGAAIFIIVFVVSCFVSVNSLSLVSLFHFICCLLSGGISGIIRVNKETNKKYLK